MMLESLINIVTIDFIDFIDAELRVSLMSLVPFERHVRGSRVRARFLNEIVAPAATSGFVGERGSLSANFQRLGNASRSSSVE